MKIILILSIMLLTLPLHSVASSTSHEVAICNECDSDRSYSNKAKNFGKSGTIVVINLDARTAKAFKVRRGKPIIADPISLPSDVMPAIQGYHDLMAAFASYANTNSTNSYHIQSEMSATVSEILLGYSQMNVANGCGTPSSAWSYAIIPNFPFEAACNAHDICYASHRSKSSCDDEFRFNMRSIVLQTIGETWFTSTTGLILASLAINFQAEVYYQAVKTSSAALAAYCNSTQNTLAAECAPNAPLQGGSTGGFITDSYPGMGGGTIFQSCELWRFPDGNNGYYYMERNCSFYMVP